jgi:predicted secreted protein
MNPLPRHLPTGRLLRGLCFLLVGMAAWWTQVAHAQPVGSPSPQNVLSLSAQATTEVTQDILIITLGVTRDGVDAAAVQAQLKQVMDAALAEARRASVPRQLEVRSGPFSLFPKYTNPARGESPRISGWQGQASLLLEGRDMARVSELAGKLAGLQVQNLVFGLSREAREAAEKDMAQQAIGRFRAQADEYTKLFGLSSYTVREVSVQRGAETSFRPMVMARGVAMAAEAAAPVPAEPGKATVSVTVTGAVQMR